MNAEYLEQFRSPFWQKWRVTRFHPITSRVYQVLGYGSPGEPHSSLWMANLSEAMGDHFREGMIVLDYGCGAARYANFLSSRLKDFTYYGLEPPESQCGCGDSRNGIQIAQDMLGKDSRIKLGYIGSELESEAIQRADVALLGSIFTHLRIEHSLQILDKLLPILDRGIIVFTAHIGPVYTVGIPGMHMMEDTYDIVYNSAEQFEEYFDRMKLRGKIVGVQLLHTGLQMSFYRIKRG